MQSTLWHSARLVRASFVLAALALAFVAPLAATHVACEHADDPATGQHQCTVCRHLQDGIPLLVASPSITAPTLVSNLSQRPSPVATGLSVPTAHGRSPPTRDSMS